MRRDDAPASPLPPRHNRILAGLLPVVVSLLDAGCSANVRQDVDALNACANNGCRLSGVLRVFAGGYGGGEITASGKCFDLALPKTVLDAQEAWDGRTVSLEGEAFARPLGPSTMWVEIKDRRVEAGGCGSSVIYVEKIELVK